MNLTISIYPAILEMFTHTGPELKPVKRYGSFHSRLDDLLVKMEEYIDDLADEKLGRYLVKKSRQIELGCFDFLKIPEGFELIEINSEIKHGEMVSSRETTIKFRSFH